MKSVLPASKGLLCLYDKQNNTWLLVDMEFLLSCSTRHLTRELSNRREIPYPLAHIYILYDCLSLCVSLNEVLIRRECRQV